MRDIEEEVVMGPSQKWLKSFFSRNKRSRYGDRKKALVEVNGNMDKAVEYLREKDLKSS